MIMIGLVIGMVALVVFFVLIAEYDKSVSGILISFLFVVIGVLLMVYDVKSPVEIIKSRTLITTEYENTIYSQPVKITCYDRKATNFMCTAKDDTNYKYEVEILSEEAIQYWENTNE